MYQETDLVICLPGNSWDINFLINLVKLQSYLSEKKINYMLSIEGGSNVSFVRERCLGISIEEACMLTQAKPFHGGVNYKFLMWIDSDMGFEPEWISRLMSHDKDIVSGFYKRNAKYYTSALWSDSPERLAAMTAEDIKGSALIRLKNNGMGFMMVKKGVFESIPRPWFLTTTYDYGSGERMIGEDTFFCLKAEQAGYQLWGDPLVKCKHLKPAYLA